MMLKHLWFGTIRRRKRCGQCGLYVKSTTPVEITHYFRHSTDTDGNTINDGGYSIPYTSRVCKKCLIRRMTSPGKWE